MSDALSNFRTRNTVTPQTEQAREDQVKDFAGGFVFQVKDTSRVKRFLTLGVDGGTYYQREQAYTKDNAKFMVEFAKNNGLGLAALVLEISESGRAPRQNPALFALALVFAFGNDEAKAYARRNFNRIVRTGAHLFTFRKYAVQFRGRGPALNKAVRDWYLSKNAKDLSYQMVKYRQREGYTHRDLLRLVKPKTTDSEKNAVIRWAVGKPTGLVGWTGVYEAAQSLGKAYGSNQPGAYAALISANPGTSWEMLPDVALNIPETWEALLDNGLPMGALIRQMPRLTKLGLLTGSRLDKIVAQLTNAEHLKAARIHPVKILYALKTYAQGRSVQGSGTWTPVQRVVDAYDAAFYASFGTIEPAGKRTMLALDCSDSMTWAQNMCGVIQAREGAVAMAMATAASEPYTIVTGFCSGNGRYADWRTDPLSGISELAISPRRRLDDNLNTIRSTYAGGTDCSLPMLWALKNRQEIDTFAIYTDNETWAGRMQPFEALRQYRQEMGINARLVVVGMSSTGFTIADPNDPLMLDVAGFDADTPSVISGFSRGDFG